MHYRAIESIRSTQKRKIVEDGEIKNATINLRQRVKGGVEGKGVLL